MQVGTAAAADSKPVNIVVLGGFVVRATSEVQGMKLETVGLSDEG